ncbi:MAG: hypothetical protein JW889_13640 [Verrucomicrobia bacterium]|nr:hypothetical protein [Verrucomicrobiota bacterium]
MTARGTLSALASAVLVCMVPVLVPAGTVGPDAQEVVVSLLIIETTPDVLAEAEDALAFSLDPARGRCVLTAEEQAALTMALVEDEHSNVLARTAAACLPGRQATLKIGETLRIPARYDAAVTPDASGKLQVQATGYTTRKIGLRFESTLLGAPSGGTATLALSLSLSRISNWQEIVPDIREPIIKTWELATTNRIPLGKALVLVNHPYQPFEPPAEAPDNEQKPRPQPVVLIVIGVE